MAYIISLRFTGPAAQAGEAVRAMRALGFEETGEGVPWREALGYADEELPGVFLAGARHREGLTQARLAEITAFPAATSPRWRTPGGPSAGTTPAGWPRP